MTPAASTSPTDLTWSHERAEEDWPGALRTEPTGCVPVVVDARLGDFIFGVATKLYGDPQGDVSPLAPAWVDIVGGEFKGTGCFAPVPCVLFDLAGPVPQPRSDPREDWIAYGIVVDTTGDGRPDLRYGVDNAPGDGELLRMWEADLNAKRTFVSACCGGPNMEAFFPGDMFTASPAQGKIAPYGWRGTIFRFYVWASLIRAGEGVWTDFAPDFGWLEWPGNVPTASPSLPESAR